MVAPVIVRAVWGAWQHRRGPAPGQTLPLAACMQGVMIPGHPELTLNHDSVVLWQLPSLQAVYPSAGQVVDRDELLQMDASAGAQGLDASSTAGYA